MYSISDNLYIHRIEDISRFYGSGIAESISSRHSGHGRIEMRRERKSGFMCTYDVLKQSIGMCDRGQHAVLTHKSTKFHGSGQFRCYAPTLNERIIPDDIFVFLRHRIADVPRILSAFLAHRQVRPLDVPSQKFSSVGIGLLGFFVGIQSLNKILPLSGKRCWEHSRGTVFGVGPGDGQIGIDRPFHKVTIPSSMNMYIDKTRRNILAFRIDSRHIRQKAPGFEDLLDYPIDHEYGPVGYLPVRRQYCSSMDQESCIVHIENLVLSTDLFSINFC